MPRSTTAPRPFGQPADLALAFDSADRPALVTALLAQCAGATAGHWWAQPVGTRTAALLRVLAASTGQQAVPMTARCAACGDPFEFDLPLAALQHDAAPRTLQLAVAESSDGSGALEPVTLRRPTGDDLRRWRQARPASAHAAVRLMLASLVEGGPLSATAVDAQAPLLAERMAALDPLVAFSVGCDCPACGHAQALAVDLEGLALSRLAACQQSLLRQVHALALRYGWTEAETLALPPERRARYLALIEAAA